MRLWSESLEWLGHGRQERGFKYAYRSSCLTVFFIVDLCSTTFPLLAVNFCVSFYRRRLRVLPSSWTKLLHEFESFPIVNSTVAV